MKQCIVRTTTSFMKEEYITEELVTKEINSFDGNLTQIRISEGMLEIVKNWMPVAKGVRIGFPVQFVYFFKKTDIPLYTDNALKDNEILLIGYIMDMDKQEYLKLCEEYGRNEESLSMSGEMEYTSEIVKSLETRQKEIDKLLKGVPYELDENSKVLVKNKN